MALSHLDHEFFFSYLNHWYNGKKTSSTISIIIQPHDFEQITSLWIAVCESGKMREEANQMSLWVSFSSDLALLCHFGKPKGGLLEYVFWYILVNQRGNRLEPRERKNEIK